MCHKYPYCRKLPMTVTQFPAIERATSIAREQRALTIASQRKSHRGMGAISDGAIAPRGCESWAEAAAV